MDYDVVVIGGGPAGSSAARRAAMHGLSVLLLEKQEMPRRKPCGGALSEHAISYLDFKLPQRLVEWECFGARVHYGPAVLTHKKNDRIAILVSRADFDDYLVEMAINAGVEVRFVPATSLEVNQSCVVTKTPNHEYTSRVVVIASGTSKRFSRYVREPDLENEEGICFEANVPVTSPDSFENLRGLIDIYFGVAQYGYGWLFHHGHYYSIGIGGLRSKLKQPKRIMQDFLRSLGLSPIQSTTIGHPIPRGGIPRTLVAPHLILVGDAAGFVDPFYGEGLAYAIRSGQLAADSILDAFGRGDFTREFLESYSHQCDVEFADNLYYSLLLSKLLHAQPSLFLKLLAADESVLARYLDIPLRRSSYKSFLQWLCPRLPILVARSLMS